MKQCANCLVEARIYPVDKTNAFSICGGCRPMFKGKKKKVKK